MLATLSLNISAWYQLGHFNFFFKSLAHKNLLWSKLVRSPTCVVVHRAGQLALTVRRTVCAQFLGMVQIFIKDLAFGVWVWINLMTNRRSVKRTREWNWSYQHVSLWPKPGVHNLYVGAFHKWLFWCNQFVALQCAYVFFYASMFLMHIVFIWRRNIDVDNQLWLTWTSA